jgi:release factor glutamine methyltransferase
MIVSNPPYVSEAEYAGLTRDVQQFEPRVALVGGTHGSETVTRLIDQASPRLRPGGWLIIEVSPMLAPAIAQLLESRDGLFEQVRMQKDLAGLNRVLVAQRRAAG